MPFFIYSFDGNRLFIRKEQIALAGNGPLTKLIKEETKCHKDFEFSIGEAKLLEKMNLNKDLHLIVADIKPDEKKEVSLFRLKEIWGLMGKDWCPICIRFEPIFWDDTIEQGDRLKFSFSIPENVDSVFTFLYLRDCFIDKPWRWGRVGSINGALLDLKSMSFFQSKINPFLKKET